MGFNFLKVFGRWSQEPPPPSERQHPYRVPAARVPDVEVPDDFTADSIRMKFLQNQAHVAAVEQANFSALVELLDKVLKMRINAVVEEGTDNCVLLSDRTLKTWASDVLKNDKNLQGRLKNCNPSDKAVSPEMMKAIEKLYTARGFQCEMSHDDLWIRW